MPLGTLERSAPSLFKQGPSAVSRLAVYSALALFLMVADARFQITGPLRQAVGTVLYPVQWLMLQPVELASHGTGYFQSLSATQLELDETRKKMATMGQRATQADQLALENERLRQLLTLRERLATPAQAAEVIYDTADPYTRRVVLDRGQLGGVALGSPVMDEAISCRFSTVPGMPEGTQKGCAATCMERSDSTMPTGCRKICDNHFFIQFIIGEYIIYMLSDCFVVFIKQQCHLICR